MSDTEQEALEAGDTWWEADLFKGAPDWKKWLAMPMPALSPAEEAFLANQTEAFCRMIDDWDIVHIDKDLPPAAWQYLKDEKFFGMIIPEEYGGLGFSALAHSTIVTKIATRSPSAAVTAMVALGALDSAQGNGPSQPAVTAAAAAATLPSSGGPPHGGPLLPIEGPSQGGARTLTRAGPDPVGPACGDLAVPPEMGGTAQDEESRERERQMDLLLALLPPRVVAQVCDFSEHEWDRVPLERVSRAPRSQPTSLRLCGGS
jgi:hypothetical protein